MFLKIKAFYSVFFRDLFIFTKAYTYICSSQITAERFLLSANECFSLTLKEKTRRVTDCIASFAIGYKPFRFVFALLRSCCLPTAWLS